MLVTIASMLLRLAALLALILGIAFWTGNQLALVPIHMLLGLIVVLTVWALGAAQALTERGSPGLAAAAFVVGALLVAVGLGQSTMLPGSNHWIVQVVHLAVAVAAVGVGESCASRYKRVTTHAV